jgi:hypothetical protein
MIKCQICQHENPDGAEYCENCGAALTTSAVPQTAATDQAAPPAEVATPDAQAASPSGTAPAVDAQPAAAEVAAPEMPAPPAAPPELPATSPAPTTGQQNPRLVAHRHGATSGDEVPLLGERLVVGRFDPETGPVDIDLSQAPEAAQISRHHAEIYRESDGRWHVKDLGSTNGVFVKSSGSSTFGPRLTAPQALASGDEVAFGNARFIFRLD